MLVFCIFGDLKMRIDRRDRLRRWSPWLFISVTGLSFCMMGELGLWTSPVFQKVVGLVILKLKRLLFKTVEDKPSLF